MRLTFLCSQGDPLLDELREAGGDELQRSYALGKVTLDVIPRSDHTFSSLDDHDRLLEVILRRIKTMSLARDGTADSSELAFPAEAVPLDNSAVGL